MYNIAVNILKQSEHKKGSIKSLVFNNKNKRNPKQIFALVCETLKYKDIIDVLIERTCLLTENRSLRRNKWLARLLVYDLLFGKGLHGKYKVLLSKNKPSLQSQLARLKVKLKVSTNAELLEKHGPAKEKIPRYVRINLIKCSSIKGIIEQLSSEYTLVDTVGCSYNSFIDIIRHLEDDQFVQDIHIAELLIFSPMSDIHKHSLYLEGCIIFQDKASCLPAFVLSELNIPPGSFAIDCCAAPGNKTSHLAAIIENKGKIFAFDKDERRLTTMRKMLLKAGTTCIELKHQDFMGVNPLSEKYNNVEYAIVDPSCSGSGIVSRLNQLTDDVDCYDKLRLEKLSNFQGAILNHALSFPSIKYAVYSTCSIHAEENEEVVQSILNKVGDRYDLVEILPQIPHRGLSNYVDIGPMCVRLSPSNDCTNGFFVACFKKKSITEKEKNNYLSQTESNSSNKIQKTKSNYTSDSSYNFKKISKKMKIPGKPKINISDTLSITHVQGQAEHLNDQQMTKLKKSRISVEIPTVGVNIQINVMPKMSGVTEESLCPPTNEKKIKKKQKKKKSHKPVTI